MAGLPGRLQQASLEVTQSAIATYAQITNDFNPLHLDPEFAARTPMGGVIAHGTMSVGLIWQAIEQTLGPDVLSTADLDIRFVKPVRIGEWLEGGGELVSQESNTYRVWVRSREGGQEKIVGTVRLVTPDS